MSTKTKEVEPFKHTYYRHNRYTKAIEGPFETLKDAAAGLSRWTHYAYTGWAWGQLADSKKLHRCEQVTPDTVDRHFYRQRVEYCITNELGDVIHPHIVKASLISSDYRNYGYEDWERRNHQTRKRLTAKKGGTHKVKTGWAYDRNIGSWSCNSVGIHRQPKTTQEIRINLHCDVEYRHEYPNIVRRARLWRNLPSSWDDIPNGIWKKQKSWKHHSKRRKQWKPT